MTKHISGIDHAVILVRDLDAARDRYESFGFTMSPRGFHSEHMGTANHTIMLQDDYFEVLSPINPTPQNTRWRKVLESGDQLAVVPVRVDDAKAAVEELRAAGVTISDPVYFERPVTLPGGGEAIAAFEAAHIAAEDTPGMAIFGCKHHTPEVVWLPRLQKHANGAKRILGVTVVVEKPTALAGAYEKIFGEGSARIEADTLIVDTGNAPIRFVTADAMKASYPEIDLGDIAAPRVLGLTLETDDIEAANRCLSAAGAGTVELRGALFVPPAEAHGVLLEFRAAE